MHNFRKLSQIEMASIRGGGNFFEDLAHGRISAAFGREGKPFIGQDFTRTIAELAPVAAVLFPAAAPVLLTVGAVAGTSSRIEEGYRKSLDCGGRRPLGIRWKS
jgi:hypothetical protein